MQLWEFVLDADRRHNLSDATQAALWFATAPRGGIPFRPKWDKDHQPWIKPIVSRWRWAVHALRSLATRLQGK